MKSTLGDESFNLPTLIALPAALRYMGRSSSPPACTSTPSPCPTSMKLYRERARRRRGGSAGPARQQAARRGEEEQDQQERREHPSRKGSPRFVTPVGRRDGPSTVPRRSSMPRYSGFRRVALAGRRKLVRAAMNQLVGFSESAGTTKFLFPGRRYARTRVEQRQ